MRFLPIIHHELLIAGRRGNTYLGRLIAVGAMSAILMWVLFVSAGNAPATLGKTLFLTIASITYFLCALTGVKLTSDSLSYERREGTLGLLFLTNLRGIEIILGKLAAGGIQAVLTLTATFPLFAVPFLFGGLTGSDFLWFVVSALNVLFLSLSLGLFASALCRDDRVALGVGILLMAGAVFCPLIAALVFAQLAGGGSPSGAEFFAGFSPATAPFLLLFERVGGIRGAATGITTAISTSMWTTLIAAFAGVVLASTTLGRLWRAQEKQPEAAKAPGGTETSQRDSQKADRAHMLDRNPYFWLASRNRAGRIAPWGVLGTAGLLWIGGLSVWGPDWSNEGVYIATGFLVHLALKLLIAGVACWQFNEDRNSGAMELVLSTPLTVGDILRGQRDALIRMFRWPIMCVLLMDLVFLMSHLNRSGSNSSTIMLVWISGMAVMVADAIALRSMGMWLGLRMRRTNAAVTRTVVCVMALPWAAMILTLSLLALLPFSVFPRMEGEFLILYWLALSMGNALLWRGWAERNLARQFRAEATGRFEAKRSFRDFFKSAAPATPPPLPPT